MYLCFSRPKVDRIINSQIVVFKTRRSITKASSFSEPILANTTDFDKVSCKSILVLLHALHK